MSIFFVYNEYLIIVKINKTIDSNMADSLLCSS